MHSNDKIICVSSVMIGIHQDGDAFFLAKIKKRKKGFTIEELSSFSKDSPENSLFLGRKSFVCGLEAKDILIKNVDLTIPPKTSWKKVVSYHMQSLHFLPPKQVACLPILHEETSSSFWKATCFTTTEMQLYNLIEQYRQKKNEPSSISTVPNALLRYAKQYQKAPENFCILHLGLKSTTCVFVDKNIVQKAHCFPLGIGCFLDLLEKRENQTIETVDFFCPKDPEIFSLWKEFSNYLQEIFSSFALEKPLVLVCTGQVELSKNFLFACKQTLAPFVKNWSIDFGKEKNSLDRKKFAISIGLLLDIFTKDKKSLQFRTGKFLPESFIRKRFWTLATSLLLLSVVFFTTYFSTNALLKAKEKTLFRVLKQALKKEEKDSLQNSFLEETSLNKSLNSWQKSLKKEEKLISLQDQQPQVSSVMYWVQSNLCAKKVYLENFGFCLEERPSLKTTSAPYLLRIDITLNTPSEKAQEKIRSFLENSIDVDRRKQLSWKQDNKRCYASFYLKPEAFKQVKESL